MPTTIYLTVLNIQKSILKRHYLSQDWMKHPWVYFEDVRLLVFVLSRQYQVRLVVLLLQDNQGGPEPLWWGFPQQLPLQER